MARSSASERDVIPHAEGTLDDDTIRAIAEVYLHEGNSEYHKKEFGNAIDFFTEGIQVSCNDVQLNAKLYSNRATAHFCSGNYQETLKDANAAIQLEPTLIKARERGASACVKLQCYKEAITWCDKGLAINETNQKFLDLRTKSVFELNKSKETHGGKIKNEFESQTIQGQKKVDCLPKTSQEERGRTREEKAYLNIGGEYCSVEDFKNVVDFYERQLKIAKEVGNRAAEGTSYFILGDAYVLLGDFWKAIDYHERHLEIAKEVKDRAGEGKSYWSLGNAYDSLGNVKRAFEYHKCHLKIAKEVGDRVGEGSAYCNLGNAYRRLGDVKKAIEFHERHLKIAKEVRDRAGEGKAYGNLGNAYFNLGDFRKATDFHERHLKIAKEVGDRAEEGRAYGSLGSDYYSLGDFKKAINYHERDLNISQEVQDRAGEGRAYGNIGNDYYSLGDFKTAIDYQERHLKIAKEMGDRATEGTAYCNLGIPYNSLGDFRKAINYHERHLKITREVEDRAGEGNAYCNLGNAHYNLGDFKTAIEYHERHLKIMKEVKDRAGEGKSHGNLGNDYYSLGDFKRAIGYHERHLEMAKEVGDKAGEGIAYCNLGIVYVSLGDFKKAIEYHERDLKIEKEVRNIAGEGKSYRNLGLAYYNLGDFKKAVDYYQHDLKIAKEVGDRVGEGKSYGNLGGAYDSLGDSKTAIDYHERLLTISKEVGDRATEGTVYGNLGTAYFSLGDFRKSIDYHERHLKIAKEVGDRAGEGNSYGSLGNAYGRLGDIKTAIKYHERGLEIAKEVGDKAGEAVAFCRLGLGFESQGSLPEALDCYHSSVKVFNDVRDHLQFKDEWKISFRDMHQTAYTSLWRLLLKQGKVAEALFAAEQGRAQALKDLMAFKYGFGTAYVGLDKPQESIYDATNCLPANTVFIAVGNREVYFWVIQNGKDFELRRRKVTDNSSPAPSTFFQSLIAMASEEIGVRAGVKCEDRSLDKLRDEKLENERSPHTQSNPAHIQTNALRTLYDVIIAPVADLVHDNELILVPEGPLCLAPYAAFVDSNSRYLCESFKIRVIPSLTSLKLIADCPDDYHSRTGALLVGDPWVQEVLCQGTKLPQLPCAREEVEMIGRILNTSPLTGTKATKDEVLKRLSSVALVHIAAHGHMETGDIALAPNTTRASKTPIDEDFLLTMRDVLSVQMRARLVVLSCCHSGRGEIKAEGVVGIARAFLGAGARSVLVSLWAIDDEATLEFMKCFYQHLEKGLSASESLNKAMKCMRESDEFNEVRYWAPFVLIGDDVTLEFGRSG